MFINGRYRFFPIQKNTITTPSKKFHRLHGLSLPLDSRQVLAWFLTAFPFICFFCVNFAVSPRRWASFWTPLFLLPYAAGLLLFIGATLTTNPLPQIFSVDYGHFCRFCREVVPNNAKHCRMCNKCRVGFDHHCRYINNCVTKSNYFIFFFGCLFFVTAALIGIIQLVYYGAQYHKNKEIYISCASNFYHRKISTLAFWILYGAALVFYLGLLIPMFVLIVYHIFFQVNGISTYDFIMDNISRFPQRLSRFSCLSNSKVRRE